MKAALLVLASILFCLVVFETGLRLFSNAARDSIVQPPVFNHAAGRPLNLRDVKGYADQIPVEPGTDREWFTEDPPPLPNRSPVSASRVALYREYAQRGLFPDQADYIWNRYYVESTRCAANSLFKNYPDTVLAFDPPSPSDHPFYRFPPNATGVAGLVTNEFGLRGPPLALSKPARTIRIAFIGSSTTVGFHNFAFSYPERVNYWLNRLADSNRWNVRFEMLNGGREGINSEDIAVVLRDELLPLDPDIAVYDGGANQFPSANLLVSPHIAPRQKIDPNDPIARHVVPEWIRTHFAVGDLVDRAANGFSAVGEPRKPAYRLNWPPAVSEQNPNVDDPHLPLQLSTIIRDLDSIRDSLQSIGSRLMLCSFEWYANDAIALSATRHRYIYEQLNTVLWPLRYADIRRLANFQNRVLRRYAAARGIPFLDVATRVPQDPDLFVDALHMTEAGERLKAWIVFAQLAPVIRSRIQNGELPRPAGSHLPPAPALAAGAISVRCEDPSGPFRRVDGVVSLETIRPHNDASIQKGEPLKIITPAAQWAFAAGLAIHMPSHMAGSPFLYLRARVLNGQVGLGVLDKKTGEFQAEKNIVPTPGLTDIYVPVLFPEQAGTLIIRNTAAGNTRSEMLVQAVALVYQAQSN